MSVTILYMDMKENRKIIIIEGPDNTGKDSLIAGITRTLDRYMYIHCLKPASGDDADREYEGYARSMEHIMDMDIPVIFNRGWHSECVYGPVYRGRDFDGCMDMAGRIDSRMAGYADVKMVMLLPDDPSVLVRNEDGKSLSHAEPGLVAYECDLFRRVSNLAARFIGVHVVRVDAGIPGRFRPKEDILAEALGFINSSSDAP